MDDAPKHETSRNRTIPRLFLDRVKTTPNEVAYRAKKLGIYKERTWLEFHNAVARCAIGLSQLGLKAGDSLALMADPCEEYIICELAAQSLGAITYGIYPTSSSIDLEYVMEDGNACIFIAGNQEYLDRIIPLFGRLSRLKHLIVIDTRGVFGYQQSALVSYDKLMEERGENPASTRDTFEAMVSKIKPSDGLSIIYTSGITGKPKGVLVSHARHITAVYALIERYPALTQGPHRAVVYLPLCSLVGKTVAVTLPLLAPVIPHYGEDVEEVSRTFFEVAPTLFFTVPNYLKRFASTILIDIENSSPLKKLAYTVAVSVGRQHVRNLWEKRVDLLTKIAYLLCYYAVFRPILNKIGLNKLKIAVSTGAHLAPKLMTLWQVYGINILEGYGLAEMGAGLVAAQESKFSRPGDVGKPLACVEVMLSDQGEVLVRGEGLSECYWNKQELSDDFRDIDGWIRTDDAGEWTPEGTLRILDRMSDSAQHGRAERISYKVIEGVLKASPYIKEAMVFGKDRAYLTALIEIEFDTVSDWANRNAISFTGFANLTQQPAVIARVGREIEHINTELKAHEQIQDFRIIPGELTPAEDEALVTPTRKIKREAVLRKFKELIESMYVGT